MNKPNLPMVLYHYTDAQGLLGIIQSKAIWATNLHYLNDAQEYEHAAMLAKRVIWEKAQVTADRREKKALMSLSTSISTGGIAQVPVFVASFSEVGDSLGQWRGYCPSGAGYSLGFVARALKAEALPQGFPALVPCIYDQESQHEAIESMLNKVMATARWAQVLKNPRDDHSYPEAKAAWYEAFLPLAPILKHRAFSEEREWRLISQPISFSDPRLRVRAGRSMLIPYVSINLAVYGSHIPLKEIIVGPTPHMYLAGNAVMLLLASNGMDERCTVESSRVPYRDW